MFLLFIFLQFKQTGLNLFLDCLQNVQKDFFLTKQDLELIKPVPKVSKPCACSCDFHVDLRYVRVSQELHGRRSDGWMYSYLDPTNHSRYVVYSGLKCAEVWKPTMRRPLCCHIAKTTSIFTETSCAWSKSSSLCSKSIASRGQITAPQNLAHQPSPLHRALRNACYAKARTGGNQMCLYSKRCKQTSDMCSNCRYSRSSPRPIWWQSCVEDHSILLEDVFGSASAAMDIVYELSLIHI